MPVDAWNVPMRELELLAAAIGLPAVGGSWPAQRHRLRVEQLQTLVDGGRPAGWAGKIAKNGNTRQGHNHDKSNISCNSVSSRSATLDKFVVRRRLLVGP